MTPPPSTGSTGPGMNSGHVKEHNHTDDKPPDSGEPYTFKKIPPDNNSASDQKIQNRQAAPVSKIPGNIPDNGPQPSKIATKPPEKQLPISREMEKMAILGGCKSIYQKALKAQNYNEFVYAAHSIKSAIRKAYHKPDIENDDISRYINRWDIKKISNSKCYLANLPDEPQCYLAITEDLDEFVQGDQALALKTYHIAGHSFLSIMQCLEGGEIRVTAIDSVGLCSSNERDRILNIYGYPLFVVARKNHNVNFKLGLLNVTSQYDSNNCHAWLSEFLRKTRDIPALTNELWQYTSNINDQTEHFFDRKPEEKGDNLELRTLNKLPARYMMAVQNPNVIRAYIEKYNNPNDSEVTKLKSLLDKEVLMATY